MSITPEPPLKTCEGRLKHGSILNGNIWLRRVSSQWKSTDAIDETIIRLLADRLNWPVKLVRWRTARSFRDLLQSERWRQIATAVLLNWIETRKYESEIATALSVLLVTNPSSRPTFDDVVNRINFPSLLSDMLLEQMYGAGAVQRGWDLDTVEPPPEFAPDRYFESHKTQDVPIVLSMNFSNLEKRYGFPFLRQWAFEWERVQERTSAPYSGYPGYFGDFLLGRSGVHPQCITRQSEVLRSAYQRTLAHAVVDWSMPLKHANFYIIDTIPVLPGFFEVDVAQRPIWLGGFAADCCAANANIEALGRQVLLASEAASEGALLSLTVPTPRDIVEFGEISLTSYFVSDDYKPVEDQPLPDLHDFVMPDDFALRGDVPECDLSHWRGNATSGTVLPATFAAIPHLHGTWHDEYLSAGLRIPCSHCFDRSTKVDADNLGLKILDGHVELARTMFWHDAWTPLNMPQGGTRIGVASYIDRSQLTSALRRSGLTLAWQVRITTYQSKDGWSDLKKQERSAFLRH